MIEYKEIDEKEGCVLYRDGELVNDRGTILKLTDYKAYMIYNRKQGSKLYTCKKIKAATLLFKYFKEYYHTLHEAKEAIDILYRRQQKEISDKKKSEFEKSNNQKLIEYNNNIKKMLDRINGNDIRKKLKAEATLSIEKFASRLGRTREYSEHLFNQFMENWNKKK